jgi:hypothetical protein
MAETSMTHMVDYSQNSKQFYWNGDKPYIDPSVPLTPLVHEPMGPLHILGPRKGEQSKLCFGLWKSDNYLDILTQNLLKEMERSASGRRNRDRDMYVWTTHTTPQVEVDSPDNGIIHTDYTKLTNSGTPLTPGSHTVGISGYSNGWTY